MTELLPLEAVAENTWRLAVGPELCSGLHTLWGGCGLGVAVETAERASGRPCSWATVQYVRPILPGAELTLAVDVGQPGRSITQAQVRGQVDGQLCLLALGALGGRGDLDAQFVRPPEDVPPPQACEPRRMPLRIDSRGTILERFEQRWAQAPRPLREDGVPGTGRTRVWVRLCEPLPTTRSALAVLADVAPSAISEALGLMAGGVSLDNTVRYARVGAVPPGGWVLVDLTVEAVVADVAQISGRLFDEAGTLLAVAGQSAAVRRRAVPRRTA